MEAEEMEKSEQNAENIVDRTIARRISIGEIGAYAASAARVADDVVTGNGAVLLPRGTELASLVASVDSLEKNLQRWDILSIPITMQSTLDLRDLEDMLKSATANITSIDPELAKETVAQVENVYGRIAEGNIKPEDIKQLASQGQVLAKEVAQAPQVMFCLGQVRSWDEYTYVHSLNVALLGSFLANRLFPGQTELAECLSMGGILHDLGKARIPQEVLNKPGRLTDDEFDIMKRHPIYGEELATGSGVVNPRILSVIRGHHERYGGGGYPDVLAKNDIPIEARISAVADVFDALTARRVYKEPMDSRAAVSIMVDNMGSHFDPDVVRGLLLSLGLYPPGTALELSDGSLGVVVGARGKDLLRPEVLLQIDKFGHKVEGLRIIDLSGGENLFVQRPLHDMGKRSF
jgi:HD-GYP domain-containing protein (c-di-GMP phosphodiesterase class II)